MGKKINVAELLKDCPKGMELDCTIYNGVSLFEVDDYYEDTAFPIKVTLENGFCFTLNKYGQYADVDFAKCVIFPKGKTTWEGFVPPSKFKDGDIVFYDNYVSIFKEWGDETLFRNYVKVDIDSRRMLYSICDKTFSNGKSIKREARFATEEEKQILFNVIKANGYHWNVKTKSLDKIEPKFKVGDRIKTNFNNYQYVIIGLTDAHYTLEEVECKFKYTEPIIEDKYWELVTNKFDITTLKPFDKVLVRNTNKGRWRGQFYMDYDKNEDYPFECTYDCWVQCIPYEGNEHLRGKTDDCDDFYKTW